MKDDSKSDEIKNKDTEEKDLEVSPLSDDDVYERDIDKELERVESLEGGKADITEGISDDAIEATPGIEATVETEAPKPTIVEIINKKADTSQKPKKPFGWIFLCIVLLLALAGAVGYYFYDKTNQSETLASLQTQIDDANQQEQVAAKKLAELKAAQAKAVDEKAAADAVKYREIPEFGLRYKVAQAMEGLIYSYKPEVSGATVQFSSLELANIREEKSPANGKTEQVFPCSFGGTALSGITQYDNGDMITTAGQPVSKVGKKIGEKYYALNEPQGLCSDKMQKEQQAVRAAIKSVFDSLEIIPVE